MREFFDTSVLVPAFREQHPHHAASFERFIAAQKRTSACSVHSLAEVYATMTALPVRPPIPCEQAFLFVQEIEKRMTLIALTAEDYLKAIQDAAANGFGSGQIYDALILACAAKCKAETIYTWNLRHFHSLAPNLAVRMKNP